MNRITATPVLATLLCSLAPLPVPAQAAPPALEWSIHRLEARPEAVQLALRYETSRGGTGTTSRPVPLRELEGLTAAQLSSSAGTPVRFRLRREAGVFDCEGSLRDGRGSGQCDFAADARFAAGLDRRGIGRPTAAQQFSLALHDVGLAFVDELASQGYARPDVAELVRAGQHGARLDYLRSMGELGYRVGSLAELVRMKDHGVNAEFVRGLASHGYRDLPADELVRLRDHGVTPRFIAEMRELGYEGLTPSQLVRMRDHGVTPDFARRVNTRAGTRRTVSELVRMRDRGETW
ncbi:MAG TPA: hypothetical protein VGR37_22690 [Longimicrobiaceae bacterium]|nr:hypothetical protein [Longimicrobiaceae bacterium]